MSIEDLSRIVIPKKYLESTSGPIQDDLIIPVVPINDMWLSSKDRSFEEVDEIFEQRLQVLAEGFSDPKSSISLSFGVEKPISGNLARFLTYVDLLDEYRVAEESHKVKAEMDRADYEREKQEIKNQGKSAGKTRKLIGDLWKGRYNPSINLHTEKAHVAHGVGGLILRKFALEILKPEESSGQISFASLPKLVDESGSLLTASDQITKGGDSFKARHPILHFVNGFSEFLLHTSDQTFITRHKYKKNPSLVNRKDDANLIDRAYEFILASEHYSESEATQKLLQRVGLSYLTFLKKQAIYYSNYPSVIEYPLVSLISDMLLAPLHRDRPQVVQNVHLVIDNLFQDYIGSGKISEELEKCMRKLSNTIDSLFDKSGQPIQEDWEKILVVDQLDLSPGPKKQLLQKEWLPIVLSDEYQIIYGTRTFIVAKKSEQGPLIPLQISNVVGHLGRKLEDLVHKHRLRSEKRIDPLDSFIKAAARSRRPFFIYDLGMGIDLISYLSMVSSSTPESADSRTSTTLPLPPNEQVSISELNEIFQTGDVEKRMKLLSKHFGPRFDATSLIFNADFVYTYLVSTFGDERLNDRLEKENEYLWQEILNNSRWFVSPRGDRFSVNNDQQLTQYGIESTTFNIDKQFAREHKVIIKFRHIDQQFEFWIDTDRNILRKDHLTMIVKHGPRSEFTNLLLRRLYAITSGILSTPPLFQGIQTGDGRRIEYKRAHYRFLTSTDQRPITMESHGAIVHAKEILEDYGIDIFKEIARRRQEGTLSPNRYVTFVREVVPEIVSNLVIPNDLAFDPALIQIPLNT